MKKIKTFALFMLLALCVTIPAAVASADEVAATSIVGHNLALEDNIEIVYIVEETAPQGAETGVLFWLSPQEEYVYGEQEYKITTPFGTVVNPNTGNTCQKYAFNYLSAKQMTENVYAVSFIKDGENITYSGVDKYSILQYAYNKKNSETILDGGTASLGEMLSAMLDYGAITQQYFGYNTERLANATYYRVSVNGGALSDGLTHGLYKDGETVTVIANEPEEGKAFQRWIDGENNVLGTTTTLSLDASEDITVSAEHISETQGLAYTLNNDGKSYSVSGIGTATDTDIIIPSTHNNLPVTRIGNFAFDGCSNLMNITIPDSVRSIGLSAFSYTGLTSVTIGNGVTSISNSAFRGCTSLEVIKISNCVTSIEYNAFYNCYHLTSIYYTGTASQWAQINGLDEIMGLSKTLYINNEPLTEVVLENITEIKTKAFTGCSSLTSIIIPDSVTSIGSHAFFRCSSLTSINVSANNLYYSSSDGILYNKDKTEIIQVPQGISGVITLPNTLTSIERSTFSGCSSLTSITIPNSVTSIGDYAFSGCSSLTSIMIPNSVTSIGDYAFDGCSSLTSITIPDSVTSIGVREFDGCSSLTSITIPDGVTSIGEYAFFNCSSLTSVYFGGNAEVWDSISIRINNTYLTNSTRYYYSEEFPTEFIENYYWHFVDGTPTVWEITPEEYFTFTLLDNDTYEVKRNSSKSLPNLIVIPSTYNDKAITSIGYQAFYYCHNLTSILIPNSIKSIEDDAFFFCDSLKSITIPDSVTTIGNFAFCNCSNLTSITIPDSVTSIGHSAFSYAGLTSITIPDSVTSIGNGAFDECHNLTNITFNGTIAQWNAISKGDYWNYAVPATVVHCSNGDVAI